MDDKRVTITCDLDQAIAAQAILQGWLEISSPFPGLAPTDTWNLIIRFDHAIHQSISEADYE